MAQDVVQGLIHRACALLLEHKARKMGWFGGHEGRSRRPCMHMRWPQFSTGITTIPVYRTPAATTRERRTITEQFLSLDWPTTAVDQSASLIRAHQLWDKVALSEPHVQALSPVSAATTNHWKWWEGQRNLAPIVPVNNAPRRVQAQSSWNQSPAWASPAVEELSEEISGGNQGGN